MPPIPVPRAAAMPVPIRRGGCDSSSFSVEKFPLGVDYLFYLFLFEECYSWGQEDQDAGSRGV